jgi:LysR family transcriptional regulator, glycine cleavage system transcriptional activator
LAPRFMVAEELAAGRLVVLCDCPVQSTQAYFLIYPDENQDLPPLRAFREWLLAEIS